MTFQVGEKVVYPNHGVGIIDTQALAKMLIEHSFADRVFFCNSGTEAVEAALKFERKYSSTRSGRD